MSCDLTGKLKMTLRGQRALRATGEEGGRQVTRKRRKRFLPFTITLVLQPVLPARFWASQMKSPASSVPRLFICKTATESMKAILYLSLAGSSCSFLYHTTLMSGDPVILHSSRAESPAFTILVASSFFTNFGGSRGWGKEESMRERNRYKYQKFSYAV